MSLILSGMLRGQIADAARAAFPNECCGLIEGIWEDGVARALMLHPAPAGDRTRFAIDPAVHFAALRAARAGGHGLIGCYHSHPGGAAQPSAADASGAGQENFFWLIAALKSADDAPVLRGWLYRAGDFTEIGVATGADFVTSSSKTR